MIEAQQLRVARDLRGLVFEPLNALELAAQRNVHVVLTEPGAIRGNHYHEQAAEWLTVLGPGLVRVREAGALRDFEVPAGEVWRFFFPPGLPHAIQNTGATPQLLVSFTTQPHDPAHPDTLRQVLIEPAVPTTGPR